MGPTSELLGAPRQLRRCLYVQKQLAVFLQSQIFSDYHSYLKDFSERSRGHSMLFDKKNVSDSIHSRIMIFQAPFVRIPNKKSLGENKIFVKSFGQKKPSGAMTIKKY